MRRIFEGCLCLVDVVSDAAPKFVLEHKVILTRAAAEAALPELAGMEIGNNDSWSGHAGKTVRGLVTAARIEGNELIVSGDVLLSAGPEWMRGSWLEGNLGMSFELSSAHVADMSAPVWTFTKANFSGGAVLKKELAAWRETWFRTMYAG